MLGKPVFGCMIGLPNIRSMHCSVFLCLDQPCLLGMTVVLHRVAAMDKIETTDSRTNNHVG